MEWKCDSTWRILGNNLLSIVISETGVIMHSWPTSRGHHDWTVKQSVRTIHEALCEARHLRS